MLQEMILKGERPLNLIENEIIAKKTEAFEAAITSLVPIKLLIYPYVKDFRRKLKKQKSLLLKTAKNIVQAPEKQQTLIKRAEKQYYLNNPFYSLVMLYIPRIIVPRHIQRLLKRFERRTRRYFRRRVKDFVAFLQTIQRSEISPDAPDKDFWQLVFPEDQMFTGYLRAQYENDIKTLKMLKKGANWRNFYTLDVLNSFSISFIPLYRLFSIIWRRVSEAMEEYMKRKVLDFYLIDTLSDRVYNILKEKSYRYLMEKVFPAPPETVMKDMHDPDFIMRFNPQKNLKVKKLGPKCERYSSNTQVLLFKLDFSWDVHYRFEGAIEEWWFTNSNYVKNMTGYCVYERTPDGHCHFYNITVNFQPSDSLATIGDLIMPILERMSKENTKTMMEKVRNYYVEQNSN
ncbi:MAG: hypothetical protein HWN66_19590 [Candidatus Helarchaeota archaeon]|nr:hypothetical protein [Candidatus Helarchaeota archaeon]